MPKKTGIIFVTLGAVLMLSALLLFLYNGYEAYRAGQEAELLLDDIQAAIAEKRNPTTVPTEFQTEPTENTEPTETEPAEDTEPTGTEPAESTEPTETAPAETLPAEMPVLVINGYEYIGYLSIPDLVLELPVMADWDYERLRIAPCRHFGSSRTDDLVIAAHNYASHFGTLSSLEMGAEIIFTDMDGIENHYTLQKLATMAPNAVDAVQNSGYDLVLYTCTPGGATRVVAFCDRVTEAIP